MAGLINGVGKIALVVVGVTMPLKIGAAYTASMKVHGHWKCPDPCGRTRIPALQGR